MSNLWLILEFREPGWLWLCIQPVLLFLLFYLFKERQRQGLAEPHLEAWVLSTQKAKYKSNVVRFVLLACTWIAFAFAMAGPRLAENVIDTHSSNNRDLFVIVDTSHSMTARDINPNRMERAKLELLDLIDRLQYTRMGLIVYAAHAHLLTPPTNDKTVLRHYANMLKTGLLPTEGSRVIKALQLAAQQLPENNAVPRAILIISDGEGHDMSSQQQHDLAEAISKLKQQGIQLYALGVGTSQGSPLLAHEAGWLLHDGSTVVSRLGRDSLQRMTTLGNGQYADVEDTDTDWQSLYDNGIARLVPQRHEQNQALVIWRELYHWFVFAGFICLVLAHWLPAKGNTKIPVKVMLVFLTLSLLPVTDNTAAQQSYDDGYQYLQDKDYEEAKQIFAKLTGYRARLGEGVASYQLGEYTVAVNHFTQAVLDADTDVERSHALFNLANSYFKLEKYKIAETIYRDVLQYKPKLQAAQLNLEYAIVLQKKREADNIASPRPGRGPRSITAMPNMDLSQGRISIGDDAENEKTDILDSARHNGTDTEQANILLDNTIAADSKIDRQEDSSWSYHINNLGQIKQENISFKSNEATVWQRLFEQEENFPAPVLQPHSIPEVNPW